MSDFGPRQAAFAQALDALLDAHGVELALVVVRHPDGVGTIVQMRGDTVWRVGAWELEKADLLREWSAAHE